MSSNFIDNKHIMIKEIKTFEELISLINKYEYVTIKFYKPFCKPCIDLKKRYEHLIKSFVDYEQAIFVKVLYDVDNELVKRFGIKKIPEVIFIRTKNNYVQHLGNSFIINITRTIVKDLYKNNTF